MSSGDRHLALLLGAPMQSWGFGSQFERRTTGLFPSKSGVAGLLCAALGVPKGSSSEEAALTALGGSVMLAIAIPRRSKVGQIEVRRMEDFHTVLDTRRASNEPNRDPVLSKREYLLDARFGVVLKMTLEWAHNVGDALQNPVWGTWLGRKCCIPAEPIYRGVWDTEDDAVRQLLGDIPLDSCTRVRDAESFESGTDTLRDQPVSFGGAESSGSHLREYVSRRICLISPDRGVLDERPAPSSEGS